MKSKDIEDLVKKIQSEPSFATFSEVEREAILTFVKHKYPMPYSLARMFVKIARELEQTYPENFYGVCILGSKANGSYLIRLMVDGLVEKSDLDYAFIGKDLSPELINKFNNVIRKHCESYNIKLCPYYSGTDYNLDFKKYPTEGASPFALPFQAVFGSIKKKVLAKAEIIKKAEEIQAETKIIKTSKNMADSWWLHMLQEEIMHRLLPIFRREEISPILKDFLCTTALKYKRKIYGLGDFATVKKEVYEHLRKLENNLKTIS